MSDNYKKVEGETDLVRDVNSTAIINRNRTAYDMAKKRSETLACIVENRTFHPKLSDK